MSNVWAVWAKLSCGILNGLKLNLIRELYSFKDGHDDGVSSGTILLVYFDASHGGVDDVYRLKLKSELLTSNHSLGLLVISYGSNVEYVILANMLQACAQPTAKPEIPTSKHFK